MCPVFLSPFRSTSSFPTMAPTSSSNLSRQHSHPLSRLTFHLSAPPFPLFVDARAFPAHTLVKARQKAGKQNSRMPAGYAGLGMARVYGCRYGLAMAPGWLRAPGRKARIRRVDVHSLHGLILLSFPACRRTACTFVVYIPETRSSASGLTAYDICISGQRACSSRRALLRAPSPARIRDGVRRTGIRAKGGDPGGQARSAAFATSKDHHCVGWPLSIGEESVVSRFRCLCTSARAWLSRFL
ncbi:hypothetical protein B0H10DRAFT_2079060, partial [Mycena sp. CBHHK59/15]